MSAEPIATRAAAEAMHAAAGNLVMHVPLALVQAAPYNPRVFAEKPTPKLVELAVSIRRTGQIEPAIVRQLPGGRYEVVAGERRLRACRMRSSDRGLSAEAAAALDAAGPPVDHLRALVRELTDEEAVEICLSENFEREDLLPLEEANGVQTLLALYKGDVTAVASRLGHTPGWVAARARLTTLSPAWRKALADDERGFQTWTAAHLVEISKLEPAAQDDLLKGFHAPAGLSVAKVRQVVVGELRTLGAAPFDVGDAALLPKVGACSTCPTTSASTPGLFADDGDEIAPSELRRARCLNPGCWTQKLMAWARAKVKELRQEHGDAAIVYEGYQDRYRIPKDLQEKAREVPSGDRAHWTPYQRVKAGTKGAWPGVFVTGDKAGSIEWFRKRPNDAAAKPEKEKKPLAERRQQLERRRKALGVSKVRDAIAASDVVPAAEVLISLAVAFGTHAKANDLFYFYSGEINGVRDRQNRWRVYDETLAAADEARRTTLWHAQLRPVLLSRLEDTGSHIEIAKLVADARRAAALVGVDHAALFAAAVAELPEPKSWAAEAEAAERGAEKKATRAAAPAEALGKREKGRTP